MSAVLSEPPNLFEDRQVAQLRVPPHSTEAESSVLGGLMLDNRAWDRVGDLLTESDFYRHAHRLIFSAIASLVNANKPADAVTVYERLQNSGKCEEVGGLGYIASLAQGVPSASNIRRYAEIVRERAILRRLITASDRIATVAFNPEGKSVEAIVDEAEQLIFEISEKETADDDWESMEQVLTRVVDHIQAQADGTAVDEFVATGLRDLDDRLDGGMREGEVIVIGARPSMGKSALGETIGKNTAKAGHTTGVLSMEMPNTQLTKRAVASESRIHLSKIKRAERLKDYDWPAFTRAVENLRGLPLYMSDRAALNINQVRAKARSLKRKHGLRVLVVDYLGLMDGLDPKQLRTYQLEEITKGLKRLAKELKISVLLLVQLSRKVEERVDQMPILSDLRDSGAIEQDADIVIFVHRPFKANPNLDEEWKYYACLSVAKLRDGEPGTVHVQYIGEHTHFQDWPQDTPIPTSRVVTKPKL